MKISLANGVVLNVCPVDENLQPKTQQEMINEARERCRAIFMAGVLLDNDLKTVARFNTVS